MRKAWVTAATLFLAASAWSAVVVLKGGKRLEVASFQQKGNYLVLVQANGKTLSYPLSAVDLEGTRKANEAPQPAPAPQAPAAPKSPFAAAVAKPGTPAAQVTDVDVQRVAPPAEAEGQGKEETSAPATAGEGVVVLGWSEREAGEGTWEILANMVNSGKVPVQDVSVSVRVTDEQGKVLATGSNTYPGLVQPGQQFTVPVTVSSPEHPQQVIFSVNWRQVSAAPEQPQGAAPPETQPKATPKAGEPET